VRGHLLFAAVLLTAGLAGCAADGEGSASVYVTDAPTDEFEEIHVVFSDAYVHEGGDEDETDTNDSEGPEGGPSTQGGPSEEGEIEASFGQHGDRGGDGGSENRFSQEAGWISLVGTQEPIDVNLLNATGTQAAFLGEANLSAGTYTQIAIVVEDAYGIDDNGTEVDITVPSGVGRVVQSFQVESGQETQTVLDLDLDRAMTASNGDWKLTPVFGQTETRVVDDAESGEQAHEPGEVAEVEA
jgi:hypothetical protein